MAQTRISESAHETLVRLAATMGKTQQEVMEIALLAYERDLFLDSVNEAYAVLRSDPVAWQQAEAEFEEWDAALTDGAGA